MTASYSATSTARDDARPARGRGSRSARPLRNAADGRLRRPGGLPARVAAPGRPMRAALLRMPFVVVLIVLLAGAVGGVLYLNTKTDESGMRAQQASATAAQLRLQIESLNRAIADLAATPRIAQEARALGMVPAGDAAILTVDAGGHTSLIGTPKPVSPAAATGSGR